MSYKLRYTGEWKDLKNNTNKLFIYRDTDLTITSDEIKIVSFEIDYPNIDYFKDESLFGCGANITLISENRLKFINELYTIKKQELKVIHTINDVINFVGWVDTEQYEDEFSNIINYPISISANNGFTVLERIAVNDNGYKLVGIYSALDIIKLCLSKLDHTFDNINIGLSTTIPNYSLLSNETILHRLFVKSENFYDEKDIPMNCREIINNILVSFGAKLYIQNNSIYIVDINTLNNDNLTLKSYSYTTLNFISDITISNKTVINEMIGSYNLSMQSGVNNASIKFNKYCYANSISYEINEKTLKDFSLTTTRTINGVLYEEDVYTGCQNYIRNDYQTVFANLKDTTREKSDDIYIRAYGVCDTLNNEIDSGNPAFSIDTNITLTSSYKWLRLSGQIMVEDVTRLDENYKINYYDGVTLDLKIKIGGYTYYNGRWIADSSITLPRPERFNCKTGDIPNNGFRINNWYTLDNAVTTLIPVVSGVNTKFFKGISVPLNSDLRESAYTLVGGSLIIEFYIRRTVFGKTDYYTFRLKDLNVSFLEEDEYGNLIDINNSDSEFQGFVNDYYLEDLEIETKQGTDLEGNSRALYLLKKSGLYSDSDYATNERFVNAESFTRTNNTATLEELLLNTYLSNLKESRYLFNVNLQNYYPIFRNFEFDLLKRNAVNVKMIPVSMAIDYINCETSLKLLEYVKDE